jgi:hypothetical protein
MSVINKCSIKSMKAICEDFRDTERNLIFRNFHASLAPAKYPPIQGREFRISTVLTSVISKDLGQNPSV